MILRTIQWQTDTTWVPSEIKKEVLGTIEERLNRSSRGHRWVWYSPNAIAIAGCLRRVSDCKKAAWLLADLLVSDNNKNAQLSSCL